MKKIRRKSFFIDMVTVVEGGIQYRAADGRTAVINKAYQSSSTVLPFESEICGKIPSDLADVSICVYMREIPDWV